MAREFDNIKGKEDLDGAAGGIAAPNQNITPSLTQQVAVVTDVVREVDTTLAGHRFKARQKKIDDERAEIENAIRAGTELIPQMKSEPAINELVAGLEHLRSGAAQSSGMNRRSNTLKHDMLVKQTMDRNPELRDQISIVSNAYKGRSISAGAVGSASESSFESRVKRAADAGKTPAWQIARDREEADLKAFNTQSNLGSVGLFSNGVAFVRSIQASTFNDFQALKEARGAHGFTADQVGDIIADKRAQYQAGISEFMQNPMAHGDKFDVESLNKLNEANLTSMEAAMNNGSFDEWVIDQEDLQNVDYFSFLAKNGQKLTNLGVGTAEGRAKAFNTLNVQTLDWLSDKPILREDVGENIGEIFNRIAQANQFSPEQQASIEQHVHSIIQDSLYPAHFAMGTNLDGTSIEFPQEYLELGNTESDLEKKDVFLAQWIEKQRTKYTFNEEGEINKDVKQKVRMLLNTAVAHSLRAQKIHNDKWGVPTNLNAKTEEVKLLAGQVALLDQASDSDATMEQWMNPDKNKANLRAIQADPKGSGYIDALRAANASVTNELSNLGFMANNEGQSLNLNLESFSGNNLVDKVDPTGSFSYKGIGGPAPVLSLGIRDGDTTYSNNKSKWQKRGSGNRKFVTQADRMMTEANSKVERYRRLLILGQAAGQFTNDEVNDAYADITAKINRFADDYTSTEADERKELEEAAKQEAIQTSIESGAGTTLATPPPSRGKDASTQGQQLFDRLTDSDLRIIMAGESEWSKVQRLIHEHSFTEEEARLLIKELTTGASA